MTVLVLTSLDTCKVCFTLVFFVFIVHLMFSYKLVQEDTINIALLHTGVIKMYGV